MRHLLIKSFITAVVIASLLTNAMPCGPSYISPMFTLRGAPEHPFRDYAAGRIGIVKPEFHRSVLFAAYRWINGSGLTPEQQQAMIDVWNADFRNRDYVDNDVTEAVKAWVEKRKDVAGKEEKLPTIYVEREYGGYDFFPNCTKNAFETAMETLAARSASHGSDNKDVRAWLAGQDAVFSNCSGGKTMPADLPLGAPEWLQKDRAYQMAAASFYSLDYDKAKERFREISQDYQSPWQETADYLVARTLIRQASLSKDASQSKKYYLEAEEHLNRFAGGGKFADSAERLLGLIRYRIRPEQRVRELAQKLSAGGSSDFRQDVIDYTWLLDKFESRALEEVAKQKEKERPPQNTESIITSGQYATTSNSNAAVTNALNAAANQASAFSNSANDVPNVANVYTNAAKPPTYEVENSYEGGYWGEEKPSLSILPNFLRQEDLNDWLFTYQINNAEAYLHALKRYKESQSELWLMTAISKANSSSAELARVLDAANRLSRTSLAYPTVTFHQARIHLATGKNAEAKKLLDEMLSRASELPVSSVNEFIKLRQSTTDTLDDYLRYSLRKPYAFNYDGSVGTIPDFIEEPKSYFNPEYDKQGKAAFEAEIEQNFANELKWQDRLMLSSETINVMNNFFPTAVLADVEKSEVLPAYLRERFATAVWMRAAILNDAAMMNRMAPKVTQYHAELMHEMAAVVNAAGPIARQNAVLALIVKNPMLTPFLEDGLGRTDNEVGEWDSDDYWCEPYDETYDEDTHDLIARDKLKRPKFLTPAQITAANSERTKIKKLGDAPKWLGSQVLLWAKRSTNDKRLPEALYLMVQANGWNKYGCGNNEELRAELARVLKTKYPNSEWAKKLISEDAEN